MLGNAAKSTKTRTLDDGPDAEVRAGLKNEQERILCARINQDYYDGLNEQYIPRRPAESTRDYEDRPKRTLDLVTQAVDALVESEYSPSPSRALEHGDGDADADDGAAPDAASEWLEGVYADQDINAVMAELDTLATTNYVGVCQIVATGDPDRPIKFTLWGADEVAVWTEPDDATKAWAVVTIDRQDEQTRYKLWDAKEVRTYLTDKLAPGQTAGGRKASLVSTEPHDYGCLPFAFVHYKRPTRRFWGIAPGETVRSANARVDIRLSELDESIERYNLRPFRYATDVDLKWRPKERPGEFDHLPRAASATIVGDGMAQPDPKINVLQATIDAVSVWADLENYILAKLETVGVPRSAVRMEQAGVASGVALIIEQAPLLKRAMKRRAHWRRTETEFARVVLVCGGNHYGIPELLAAAEDIRLSLVWPEPFIPFPDPVRSEIDKSDIAMGLKSVLGVVMQRYDMTRDQAVAYLEQVAEDEDEFKRIFPDAVDPMAPVAKPGAAADPSVSTTTNPDVEPGDGMTKSEVTDEEVDA